MASYVGGFLLLSTLMSMLVVLMSQLYKANLEFDNKVSIVKPIYIKHADSLAMCASFCGFGCKCFNFNLQTGMCQPYNSCNALYMTVDEIGWRLYDDQTVNTNGEYLVFTRYSITFWLSIYVTTAYCSG